MDLLGFGGVVDAVVRVLDSGGLDPVTIGIQSGWGGGKSTLLKLIEERLEDTERLLVVKVDPWEFEDRQDVRGTLIALVLNALQERIEAEAGQHSTDHMQANVRRLDGLRRRIAWGRAIDGEQRKIVEHLLSESVMVRRSALQDVLGMTPDNQDIIVGALGESLPLQEDAKIAFKYTNAVWDDAAQAWISDAEVAEISFTAFGSKAKAKQVTARLIVRRVPDLNPKNQSELFTVYRYHAVFTNQPAPMPQAEKAHRGHAIVEQVIADLKNGPLAHLPSGNFWANSAWLVCAAMAYNLTRTAGALASVFHAKATTGTPRAQLINIPGRLSHSARRFTLHLPTDWPWETAWTRLATAAGIGLPGLPEPVRPRVRPGRAHRRVVRRRAGRTPDRSPRRRGTPQVVVLQPGERAHAELRVVSYQAFRRGECRPTATRGFRVYPPDQTAATFVPAVRTACANPNPLLNLLTVGPVVAGGPTP